MLYVALTSFLFLLRFAVAGQGMARNQLYFVVLAALFMFSAFRCQHRLQCRFLSGCTRSRSAAA